jgi:hypothetical protein
MAARRAQMGAHRQIRSTGMSEEKRSLQRMVEKNSQRDNHLLFQTSNEERAVEIARRIHEGSNRAGKPFVVFDARQLPGGTTREILDAFSERPIFPIAEVDSGTLVILHMEEAPEEFQHVFAKVLDVDTSGTGQRISGSAVLPFDGRVILIEPHGVKPTPTSAACAISTCSTGMRMICEQLRPARKFLNQIPGLVSITPKGMTLKGVIRSVAHH